MCHNQYILNRDGQRGGLVSTKAIIWCADSVPGMIGPMALIRTRLVAGELVEPENGMFISNCTAPRGFNSKTQMYVVFSAPRRVYWYIKIV